MTECFFQELCEHVQDELVETALSKVSEEKRQPIESAALEDLDYYLNTHNLKQTVPQWFRTVMAYRFSES